MRLNSLYLYELVNYSLVVSALDSAVQIQLGPTFVKGFARLHSLANLAILSTLTTHCQWEDQRLPASFALGHS